MGNPRGVTWSQGRSRPLPAFVTHLAPCSSCLLALLMLSQAFQNPFGSFHSTPDSLSKARPGFDPFLPAVEPWEASLASDAPGLAGEGGRGPQRKSLSLLAYVRAAAALWAIGLILLLPHILPALLINSLGLTRKQKNFHSAGTQMRGLSASK